jgi:hypothetical protein
MAYSIPKIHLKKTLFRFLSHSLLRLVSNKDGNYAILNKSFLSTIKIGKKAKPDVVSETVEYFKKSTQKSRSSNI